ncbi:MAG: 16S rRNA (adenine(1518)-N(6)/adenine(1519)-N(6))-dimethyltransferase RsmA [Candidatus Hodarchaeota archaeon]
MDIHDINYFLSKSKIIQVLEQLASTPSKKYGQNFFISKPTIQRIIDLCNFKPDENVLEIGPGLGVLTMNIAPMVKKLIAIEINPLFKEYLEKFIKDSSLSNVDVVLGDALKEKFPDGMDKIVSAMPYSISAPLTFKILKYMNNFNTKAFLVSQREFASKLVATPGTRDYSRISINTSLFATAEMLMQISRNNFYPTPKVDSSFFKLSPKPISPELDTESLLNLTRGLFPYKNKTLGKAIRIYSKNFLDSGITFEIAGNMPLKDKRVRELGENDLITLVNWFKKNQIAIK